MVLALLAAVVPLADDPAFPSMDSCFVISAGDSIGAGFMAQGDLIITAAHVVGDAGSVELSTGEVTPRRFSGRVVIADRKSDIAVIAPNTRTGVKPLPLASSLPETGEVVYAVGSPIGQLVASRGLVTGIHGDRIESTTPVDHGSSGGPLVDGDGVVVGVVVELSGLTGHAFSVPAETVERVLGQAQSEPPVVVTVDKVARSNPWGPVIAGLVLLLVVSAVLGALWNGRRRRERNRIIITFEGN